MSVKIDIDKKGCDRRIELWNRFGKVVSRKLEFLKKFDTRAYLLGLDAIEGVIRPTWIETKKRRPTEGTTCIIDHKGEVHTSFFENDRFNTRHGAFKPEDVIKWYPYPNDFKPDTK